MKNLVKEPNVSRWLAESNLTGVNASEATPDSRTKFARKVIAIFSWMQVVRNNLHNVTKALTMVHDCVKRSVIKSTLKVMHIIQQLLKSLNKDVDECLDPSPCGELMCVNTIGSYLCICPTGYSKDYTEDEELHCTDVDECHEKACGLGIANR